MDYTRILKRAWSILWSYRALWVFGFILALTGGMGINRGGRGQASYQRPVQDFDFPAGQDFARAWVQWWGQIIQGITPQIWQTVVWVVWVLIVFILLLAIIFTIARYVSQVAMIRMVDRYETSQEKVPWREGFRLGWSKAAWRMFLINLVIVFPLTLLFILLFFGAALPVIASILAGKQPAAVGIVASVGLVFLVIFLAIIIALTLGLIMEIIWRECVLGERGVFGSIRQGWGLVRRNLKDVFIFWLILLVIKIGYFIVMIPVFILLAGIGMLAGGAVGLPIGLLGRALLSGPAFWLPGAILGGLAFLIVLGIPLLFLGGLRETYLSSSWTLAYRELVGEGQLTIDDGQGTEEDGRETVGDGR